MSEHKDKLGLFEYTQNMSKRPAESVYIGNIIDYLSYLLTPFSRGLEVYLEGSSTFLLLMLSMYTDRLDLVSPLYK